MRIWSIILTIFISMVLLIEIKAQENEASLDLNRIERATVFVIQASDSDLDTRCVGSGTIVRFDGLILTNAHNVVTSEACPGDELIIAMSLAENDPPVPKYRASIAQVDVGLDLALLRIDRELDGRIIEAESLPILPFVELANSNDVILDETLTLVGYPDLGNSGTVTERVSVAAFMAEPSGGDKSWFKLTSDNTISGLMSGGGAYNQSGQLIGVPTSAPITNSVSADNCLRLEDTNNDGFINSDDGCVPISTSISVIRPVNFARSLIRSASLRLSVESLTAPLSQTASAQQPRVDRLYFTTSVNNNLPTQVIGTAPAGTTSLYLFFDYFNFSEETVYEVRVSVDGVPSQVFSLPPVRWSGGINGLWHIGSSGQPWSNGRYEFRILVNGLVASSSEITIGGVPTEQPSFTDIVFGIKDENDVLQGESYVLPTGDVAAARFIYRNLQPGTEWQAEWYYNGALISAVRGIWTSDEGINGARDDIATIRPEGGFIPGNYRVNLYVGTPLLLSVTGDFIVAGTPEGVLPNVFSNIEFLRANNTFSPPSSSPAVSFPDGANTIYAQFDWQRIAPGTLWTMQWLVDGEVFYQETSAWNTEESGQDFQVRLTAPDGLPDGTYTMNFIINGVLLQSAQVSVGIGQLSINRLEEIGGTQLGGQIVDADSGEGIEGATFVLISEDFSVADFVWDAEQIYALAIADRNGRFEVDRPLEFDAPYSLYVLAEGYLPITQDGFLVNPENLAEAGGSPINMLIPLTKD